MKVFVVLRHVIEDTELVGVFSTLEKAEEVAKKQTKYYPGDVVAYEVGAVEAAEVDEEL